MYFHLEILVQHLYIFLFSNRKPLKDLDKLHHDDFYRLLDEISWESDLIASSSFLKDVLEFENFHENNFPAVGAVVQLGPKY